MQFDYPDIVNSDAEVRTKLLRVLFTVFRPTANIDVDAIIDRTRVKTS